MLDKLLVANFDNLWLTSLLVVFCVCIFIQLLYYWGIFGRLGFYKNKTHNNIQLPVSVIICAKNEFHNLTNNLPIILEQDYPEFEVVVVDDCSDDDTYYLLMQLEAKYKRLKIITLKETVSFVKGKKFPLALGIKSALHEQLLLTDADCCPKSNQWINEMQKHFSSKAEVVLGYGCYKREKGFLNTLIRFDTCHIAMQYLSYALAGFPYMGVGRNLAYTKSVFYKNKGFSSIYHIKSGDDDLFINKAATAKATAIEIGASAHTVSAPKVTMDDWIKQKKRHLSTGKYYKFKHKFLLAMFSITLFLSYALFIILTILLYNIVLILPLLLIRIFSQMYVFKKCMKKLDEKDLLLISPLLEFFFLILNPILVISNSLTKQDKWK